MLGSAAYVDCGSGLIDLDFNWLLLAYAYFVFFRLAIGIFRVVVKLFVFIVYKVCGYFGHCC